ncbi:fatty acid synthase-like, partial [Pseudomyrmex gracilis]|uniref:fatty acid synthase-like n=1 Tax=Pseudomyrmex gracilis TaxID=219809 RepID=UPI0009950427
MWKAMKEIIRNEPIDMQSMSDHQAHTLDPILRLFLEHTYEAIVDAGINPVQLNQKNVATIVATSMLESQEAFLYRDWQINSLNIVGCSKTTVANLITYWLDLKGSSYLVDTACSASLYAITLAYNIITSGRCESAIVAAGNLCLQSTPTRQFSRLGVLSPTGYCRPFDVNANEYCRSETVSVIYLQTAKHTKRIYVLCKHITINSDRYKEKGITFLSEIMQTRLLTEFYQHCDISPTNALKRTVPAQKPEILKTPLWIGSVKSNLGHAEPASDMNQIAKAIIAMETGFIPAMINFTLPQEDIESLKNGSVRVVTEPTRLTNGFISMNSFGFGGANSHMLLQWNRKKKTNNGAPNDDFPRLVPVSGRTEESVKSFLKD